MYPMAMPYMAPQMHMGMGGVAGMGNMHTALLAPEQIQQLLFQRAAMQQQVKSPRWSISKQSLLVLEEIFRLEKFPSAEMRRRLASDFGVAPRQVQFWFQNRRQRERRSKLGGGGGGHLTPTSPGPEAQIDEPTVDSPEERNQINSAAAIAAAVVAGSSVQAVESPMAPAAMAPGAPLALSAPALASALAPALTPGTPGALPSPACDPAESTAIVLTADAPQLAPHDANGFTGGAMAPMMAPGMVAPAMMAPAMMAPAMMPQGGAAPQMSAQMNGVQHPLTLEYLRHVHTCLSGTPQHPGTAAVAPSMQMRAGAMPGAQGAAMQVPPYGAMPGMQPCMQPGMGMQPGMMQAGMGMQAGMLPGMMTGFPGYGASTNGAQMLAGMVAQCNGLSSSTMSQLEADAQVASAMKQVQLRQAAEQAAANQEGLVPPQPDMLNTSAMPAPAPAMHEQIPETVTPVTQLAPEMPVTELPPELQVQPGSNEPLASNALEEGVDAVVAEELCTASNEAVPSHEKTALAGEQG